MRIFIWGMAILLFMSVFYQWYRSIPPLLEVEPYKAFETKIMEKISGNYGSYKSQEFLLYWAGETPIIDKSTINFLDGIWIIRSIDPTGLISFTWPNKITGTIQWKWTVFLDFKNNILLSIDALIVTSENAKILPSFFVQNDKKMFYDLNDVQKIVGKELWEIYKKNIKKDEKDVYSGFSDDEIKKNINTILAREPKKDKAGNSYFKKDLQIRNILENILNYMENVKKQKKCGETSDACIRFITRNIQEVEGIDANILIWLKDPLIMWAKKNSNPEDTNLTWESIFQKYHLDVLANDPLAVNTRDNSILTMIKSSRDPTYEMWLYLTFILSKEKKWSPYSLKIMTEMVRLGNILEKDSEHKEIIIEESNRALSSLRKVLEESYFDKLDSYLFVLKKDLKDDKGQKIDTVVFVNDLNQLIAEIDTSTLFLEYPDFRVLRRHLAWFTCIFQKNKEYIQDRRVCRGEI